MQASSAPVTTVTIQVVQNVVNMLLLHHQLETNMTDRILELLDNSRLGRFLYALIGWAAIGAGVLVAASLVGIFIKPILIILLVTLVVWFILY